MTVKTPRILLTFLTPKTLKNKQTTVKKTKDNSSKKAARKQKHQGGKEGQGTCRGGCHMYHVVKWHSYIEALHFGQKVVISGTLVLQE